MGTLRFLLAMSVLSAHLAFYPHGLPHPVDPGVAVEGFYIVSGFLITLVLHEKYQDSLANFYTNRALRIFPMYWAAVVVYLLVGALLAAGSLPEPPANLAAYRLPTIFDSIGAYGSSLDVRAILLIAATNIFIFGQDAITFVSAGGGFTASPDLLLHKFMIIRVAWTLAIELGFYVVAPFIVRRPLVIGLGMLASIVAQVICHQISPINPVWYSRILPFALTWFMAGAAAYHVFRRLRPRAEQTAVKAYCVVGCTVVLVVACAYPHLPFARLIFLSVVAACLPAIVLSGRINPFDKILGDLSYPVYLLHPLFLIVILSTWQLVPVALSLLLSLAMVFWLERPLDKYRQARLVKVRPLAERDFTHATGEPALFEPEAVRS